MKVQLPTRRQRLDLERPDLSAREAVQLISPSVAQWPWEMTLVGLASAGAVQPNGRLHVGVGGWQFWFWCPTEVVGLSYLLFFNGNLSFDYPLNRRGAPPGAEITEPWLDSVDVARVVAGEPAPEGHEVPLNHLVLTPHPRTQYWEAWRTDYSVETGTEYKHKLLVDARTGCILFETFERSEKGRRVNSWQRVRDSNHVPSG